VSVAACMGPDADAEQLADLATITNKPEPWVAMTCQNLIMT